MHCPACGTSVEADQQFCRSCGTVLGTDAPRRINPRAVMLIAVLVLFIGVTAVTAGSMTGLQWLTFTGVFIAIAAFFSMMAGALFFEMRGPRRPPARKVQLPLSVERADTTNKLLHVGENDFVPSVVENTTELLYTPKPREGKFDAN